MTRSPSGCAQGAGAGHVIPAVIGERHSVSALARTPEKATALAKQGEMAVSVSIFDWPALTAAFASHNALANLASAMPPMTQVMRAKA